MSINTIGPSQATNKMDTTYLATWLRAQSITGGKEGNNNIRDVEVKISMKKAPHREKVAWRTLSCSSWWWIMKTIRRCMNRCKGDLKLLSFADLDTYSPTERDHTLRWLYSLGSNRIQLSKYASKKGWSISTIDYISNRCPSSNKLQDRATPPHSERQGWVVWPNPDISVESDSGKEL